MPLPAVPHTVGTQADIGLRPVICTHPGSPGTWATDWGRIGLTTPAPFTHPGGNTDFRMLVPIRGDGIDTLAITFADHRYTAPTRRAAFTFDGAALFLTSLGAYPSGWAQTNSGLWRRNQALSYSLESGANYNLFLDVMMSGAGLIVRCQDEHSSRNNFYGAVENITVTYK